MRSISSFEPACAFPLSELPFFFRLWCLCPGLRAMCERGSDGGHDVTDHIPHSSTCTPMCMQSLTPSCRRWVTPTPPSRLSNCLRPSNVGLLTRIGRTSLVRFRLQARVRQGHRHAVWPLKEHDTRYGLSVGDEGRSGTMRCPRCQSILRATRSVRMG